ncbi:hypothetical protein PRZ48_006173 [Zasmidium cellare]|uniref:Glycosyltransferase family 69 protein n=1 Tax=Zasmidium cellare TaxID=395010 RepID=A0ABR0EMN7_ZASCE|nr:hypothetical protein PRZ48_006173 [Zasmidium cellare]
MDPKPRVEEEALLHRTQSGSSTEYDDEELLAYELDDLEDDPNVTQITATTPPRWWISPKRRTGRRRNGSGSKFLSFHTPRRRRSIYCRVAQLLMLAPYMIFSAIIICGVFFPSYSYPPQRYLELRDRVQELGQTANINDEKVFIAASLYDHKGELVGGQWGQSVLRLIEILGPDNVFLSLYENDPDEMAQAALDEFAKNVTCDSAIVTEQLDLQKFPHVSAPDGSSYVKRITFLADVRNRALRPLEDSASTAHNTTFDKLLYLNDVIFDPVDAANLLFSTNVDESTGRTQYRAACAVDFINPFKFYDTFATRDLEGYDTGVPFYPWFTGGGQAESRRDVLEQKDAVRVKSCWGGMVAFEAKWFQRPGLQKEATGDYGLPSDKASAYHTEMGKTRDDDQESADLDLYDSAQLRFRAETDTYWDSSECCLIHADLSAMDTASLAPNETGIYMNPYIRVAYDGYVLPWLSFTKRFERLYTPIHVIVNWIADRPSFNPRQYQGPGDEVVDRVWRWDEDSAKALETGTFTTESELQGHWEEVNRTAQPGGFCGMRKLLIINEHPLEGQKKWGKFLPPIPARI